MCSVINSSTINSSSPFVRVSIKIGVLLLKCIEETYLSLEVYVSPPS